MHRSFSTRPPQIFRRSLLALLAALVLAAGSMGCASSDQAGPTHQASGRPATSTTSPTTAVSPTTSTAPATLAELVPGPDTLRGLIATPVGAPVVHRSPAAAAPVIDVPATTSLGAPTTFAVLGEPAPPYDAPGRWLQVLLPSRPNGATGWVEAGSVIVTRTSLRIEVDRAARVLRVLDGEREVLTAPVAVGSAENPTPSGASSLIEVVDNPNPGGAYGPFAFGLGLHSDTLTEFAGGPGQVGIHGTDEPELIGQAVSHGCIRVANADSEALAAVGLPLGAPVIVS